jgi:hypothetical protein
LIEKDPFSYSRLLGTPPPMKSGETGSIPSRRVITTEVRRGTEGFEFEFQP